MMVIIGQTIEMTKFLYLSFFSFFSFFSLYIYNGKNEKTRKLLNHPGRSKIEVFAVFRGDDTLGNRFIKKPIAM